MLNGLSCNYFKGASYIKPNTDSTFTTTGFYVPKEINAPSFALIYQGYIRVPETGIYSFYLTCDDGGILKINNELVVDNDGLHSALEKSGQAALGKGLHPIVLKFIEGGGGYRLTLKYSKDGAPLQDIPVDWLYH